MTPPQMRPLHRRQPRLAPAAHQAALDTQLVARLPRPGVGRGGGRCLRGAGESTIIDIQVKHNRYSYKYEQYLYGGS